MPESKPESEKLFYKINTYEANIPPEDLIWEEGPSGKMKKEVYELFKKSIEKFGIVYNVLVVPSPEKPGKYEVVDGRHRVEALIEEGADSIPCTIINEPYETAYLLSYIVEACRKHLSEEEHKNLSKKTNELVKEYVSFLEKTILHELKKIFDKETAENLLREIKKNKNSPDYVKKLKKIKNFLEKLSEFNPLPDLLKSHYEKLIKTLSPSDSIPDPSNLTEIRPDEELLAKNEQILLLKKELEEKEKKLKNKEKELERIKSSLAKIKNEIEKKVKDQIASELAEKFNISAFSQLNTEPDAEYQLQQYRLQQQYQKLQNEYEKLKEEYVNRTREIDQQKTQIEYLKNELKKLQNQINFYEKEKEKILEEKNSLTRILHTLNPLESLLSSLSSLSSSLTEVKNKLLVLSSLFSKRYFNEELTTKFSLLEKKWNEIKNLFNDIDQKIRTLKNSNE